MFLFIQKFRLCLLIMSLLSLTNPCVAQSRKADANISVVNSIRNDLITISFASESSFISNLELEKINSFLKLTAAMSPIDRYFVAAWSDRDYPTIKKLSPPDIKLAKERASAVKNALSLGGANIIDTFEMTKRPNWIQTTLGTNTAQLKGEGLTFTMNAKLLKDMNRQMIQQGGPGKVVIIAKFKREFVEI